MVPVSEKILLDSITIVTWILFHLLKTVYQNIEDRFIRRKKKTYTIHFGGQDLGIPKEIKNNPTSSEFFGF